jgi:hypothetical protein
MYWRLGGRLPGEQQQLGGVEARRRRAVAAAEHFGEPVQQLPVEPLGGGESFTDLTEERFLVTDDSVARGRVERQLGRLRRGSSGDVPLRFLHAARRLSPALHEEMMTHDRSSRKYFDDGIRFFFGKSFRGGDERASRPRR